MRGIQQVPEPVCWRFVVFQKRETKNAVIWLLSDFGVLLAPTSSIERTDRFTPILPAMLL
jgi:hypothetical protein